jgi:hypothetical protein
MISGASKVVLSCPAAGPALTAAESDPDPWNEAACAPDGERDGGG